MISRLSYTDFFQKVTGFLPYPCQVTYAEIDADYITLRLPTGIGKTLTVLVSWLYRQYQGNAPTRLVIMEPMRVLVSQVVTEAKIGGSIFWAGYSGSSINGWCDRQHLDR